VIVWVQVASPLGALTLRATDAGLCSLGVPREAGTGDAGRSELENPVLRAAASQLGEYFAGLRRSFDLPLDLDGTPFQLRVWNGLQAIPFGETVSYSELGLLIGEPGKARAVGAANARNPVAIIVPCHRVVGSDGSLTGYGGGLDAKRALLEHEARVKGSAPP
jgi:methylated-DNA-[protein]-cysteine S-methyltransferase